MAQQMNSIKISSPKKFQDQVALSDAYYIYRHRRLLFYCPSSVGAYLISDNKNRLCTTICSRNKNL